MENMFTWGREGGTHSKISDTEEINWPQHTQKNNIGVLYKNNAKRLHRGGEEGV